MLALTWHPRTMSSAEGRPTPLLWLPSGDTVMGSGSSGLPLVPTWQRSLACTQVCRPRALSAPGALSRAAGLCSVVIVRSCDQPAAGLGESGLAVSMDL